MDQVQTVNQPLEPAGAPPNMSPELTPPAETPGGGKAAPYVFATFFDRLFAVMIDAIILLAIGIALGIFLGLVNLEDLGGAAGTLINWGYLVYFIGSQGATPGKKVMKIRVIKTDGSSLSFVDAFVREIVGKFVSGLILGLGFLWMLWDPNKQNLHDKIAKTYVIKG